MTRLPRFLRKALALALLIVPLALIAILAVVPAISRLSDLKESIEQERRLAGRLAAVAEAPPGASSNAALADAARGLFIEGASEAIRSAALQSHIVALAARNGVKPRSTRNLPVRDKGEVRLLGVQIQLVASIEKLQALIIDVERHKPGLIISGMQVTPSLANRRPGGEPGAVIDARLEIVAVEAR